MLFHSSSGVFLWPLIFSFQSDDMEVLRDKYFCSQADFKLYQAPTIKNGPLSLFASDEMQGVGQSLKQLHDSLRFAFRLQFESVADLMLELGKFQEKTEVLPEGPYALSACLIDSQSEDGRAYAVTSPKERTLPDGALDDWLVSISLLYQLSFFLTITLYRLFLVLKLGIRVMALH